MVDQTVSMSAEGGMVSFERTQLTCRSTMVIKN